MTLALVLMSKQFNGAAAYDFELEKGTKRPVLPPVSGRMWPTSIAMDLARRGHETTVVVVETSAYLARRFAAVERMEHSVREGCKIVYTDDVGAIRDLLAPADAIVIRDHHARYAEIFDRLEIGDRPVVQVMATSLTGDPDFVPPGRRRTLLVNDESEVTRFARLYDRVEVLRKPAAPEFFEAPPRSLGKSFDVVSIIWDLALPRKRADLLLQSLPLLDKLADRRLQVGLVGDASPKFALRVSALNAALDKTEVSLLGQLSREGVRETLHRSRVSVVPSSIDPNPQVIAESLACNVPVACASDLTGGRFQITPRTGEFFEPDPDDLARTLWNMLCRERDYEAATGAISIEEAADQMERLLGRA